MGEEWDEVLVCMRDLRRSDVNILTLGQYLRPSDSHLPVARYYTPDEFAELRDIGLAHGLLARAVEPADPVVVPRVGAGRPALASHGGAAGLSGQAATAAEPSAAPGAASTPPAPTSTAAGSARCC